jgi:arylsulfatase A-like enzyme
MNLDVLPTCLAAAGITTNTSMKLDGVDLIPYLKGENTNRPHETLRWRFGDQWAVRHGDWKLTRGDGQPEPGLYNLADDPAESRDRAADHPEIVKDLQARYRAWEAEQAPAALPREVPARALNRNRPAPKAAAPKSAIPSPPH